MRKSRVIGLIAASYGDVPISNVSNVDRECDHEWEYYEDKEHTYTGYLERCKHCGEIKQVPQ